MSKIDDDTIRYKSHDMVNSPDHYKQLPEEAIVYIGNFVSWLRLKGEVAYLIGTAFKYLFRFPWKEAPARDLRKAAWYITRAANYIDTHEPEEWYDGSL